MEDASDSRPRLGDILTKLQLVDDEQVEAALEYQGKSGKLFGESLLDLGFIGEDDLSWALSSQLGLPFVAATPEMADARLIGEYPADFLRRHLVLPLVATETSLSLVLADPTDKTTMARLKRISGLELSMAVGTPSAIKRALDSVLGESDIRPIKAKSDHVIKTRPASLSSPELTQLIDRALTEEAACIHLDPEGNRVRVRFRSPLGELSEGGWYETEFLEELVDALGNWLGTAKTPAPGITVWDHGPHSDPLPFRATYFSGFHGPSLTLFMDESPTGRHKLAAAYEDDWSRFDTLLSRARGLVVAVAPTRHGREQVIARLLGHVDGGNRRICALVDDDLPLPTSIIRLGEELTPTTTHAFCSMDGVDVLAGLFEGMETLNELAEAGSRDRLVIAAFPGNGALGFLARMLEDGVSSTLLAEALLAVIAQQTVESSDDKTPPRAVAEALFVDRPVRQALQNGGSIDELRAAAADQGFQEIALRVKDLDAVDRSTLEDLERHRYLEDAA